MPIATNFGDAGAPGLVQELHAHHQVVVEELRRMLAVGADAADVRGQVDDQIDRLPLAVAQARAVRQEPLDGRAVPQVALLTACRDDLRRASRPKRRHHCPAEEPGAAGDEHALMRPRCRPGRAASCSCCWCVSLEGRGPGRAGVARQERRIGETHSSTRRACQVQDPIVFSWVPVAQRQPMVGFIRAPGRRDIREESARRWSASCCYRTIAAIRIASTR